MTTSTPSRPPLSVVILAAGQGKRMKSDLPKVVQPLAGRPMLAHVIFSSLPAAQNASDRPPSSHLGSISLSHSMSAGT